MASNFLKEKLTQAAQQSPAFQAMELAEQARVISQLEAATDEQVIDSIKVFEEDFQEFQKKQLEYNQKQANLVANAEALSKEITEDKLDLTKADKQQEENAHSSEIDHMEKEIDNLVAPVAPPKKKKFLGIF